MSRKLLAPISTVVLKTAVLLCMVLAATLVLLRYSGYELLSVQSNSMLPMMRSGDAVLLSRKDIDVKIGDVVSYADTENPKIVITHRVIGIDLRRGVVSTKGDDTAIPDVPIAAWNIQGIVRHVVPGLGHVLNLFRSPLGLAIVVYAPTLGIIVAEIRRLSVFYTYGVLPGRTVRYSLYGRKSARIS